MEIVHPSNLCLAALVFVYSLNLAPMMFESFTSDRIWASNPPASFYMFLGPYGQKTAHYWRIVSPLALAAFLLSIVLNWQVLRRTLWLSIAFVFYLAVQVSTMAYFVREQDRLIASADTLSREAVRSRATRWIALNYFRMVAAVLAYVFLLCAVLESRLP
jgi:Anthrone oxygenase